MADEEKLKDEAPASGASIPDDASDIAGEGSAAGEGNAAGEPAGDAANVCDAAGDGAPHTGDTAGEGSGDPVTEEAGEQPARSVLFGLILFFVLLVLIAAALSTEVAESLVALPRPRKTAPSQRQRAQSVVDRSLALRARGQYDESYALLIDFHNRFPGDALVNLELGRYYLGKTRSDYLAFAEQYFELAAEKLPNNPKVAFFQGKLCLRRAQAVMVEANRKSMKGQTRIRAVDRAETDLRRARRFLDRAIQGELKYDLQQVSELLRQVRIAHAENGIQAALAFRNLARGPVATNEVTMRRALERAQAVLKLRDVLPSHHLRARELIADFEAEIRKRGR